MWKHALRQLVSRLQETPPPSLHEPYSAKCELREATSDDETRLRRVLHSGRGCHRCVVVLLSVVARVWRKSWMVVPHWRSALSGSQPTSYWRTCSRCIWLGERYYTRSVLAFTHVACSGAATCSFVFSVDGVGRWRSKQKSMSDRKHHTARSMANKWGGT
jgi:hypothetical protein